MVILVLSYVSCISELFGYLILSLGLFDFWYMSVSERAMERKSEMKSVY